jgi:hypothetical protein
MKQYTSDSEAAATAKSCLVTHMHDPVEGFFTESAVMTKLQVQSTSKIAHVLAQQQNP